MSHKYDKPPITEVVCEFRLATDTPWDSTIPGSMYEELKKSFSHKESRLLNHYTFPIGQDSSPVIRTDSEVLLLFTLDRKTLIQIGNHTVSINKLAPYPGWSILQPEIEHLFKVIKKIINPTSFLRLGLRYINNIPLSNDVLESDFFEIDLETLRSKDYNIINYQHIYNILTTHSNNCRLVFGKNNNNDGNLICLLDMDCYIDNPQFKEDNEYISWIDNAHSDIIKIFESSITDKCRQTFK